MMFNDINVTRVARLIRCACLALGRNIQFDMTNDRAEQGSEPCSSSEEATHQSRDSAVQGRTRPARDPVQGATSPARDQGQGRTSPGPTRDSGPTLQGCFRRGTDPLVWDTSGRNPAQWPTSLGTRQSKDTPAWEPNKRWFHWSRNARTHQPRDKQGDPGANLSLCLSLSVSLSVCLSVCLSVSLSLSLSLSKESWWVRLRDLGRALVKQTPGCRTNSMSKRTGENQTKLPYTPCG